MSTLIEQTLRSRGVRYFRGHHDGEFFFMVVPLTDSARGRLHVHLRPGVGDEVAISISGGRFRPAAQRDALTRLAARCNALFPVEVTVQDSCDPGLVGVLVTAAGCPAGAGELSDLIDIAVDVAADILRRVPEADEAFDDSSPSVRRSA